MRTRLTAITQATPLVSIDEAASQLRLVDSGQDSRLEAIVNAAMRYVERIAGRAFEEQTWSTTLECFPEAAGDLELIGPIQSVETFNYYNDGGTEVALGSYQIEPDGFYVAPDPGDQWPTTERGRVNAVTIEHTAGDGVLPDPERQAVLLMVGHFWRNREAVVDGPTRQLELAVRALLATDRRIPL